jgi:NhaP-type Na+/H+ or K+/H+ antiporter
MMETITDSTRLLLLWGWVIGIVMGIVVGGLCVALIPFLYKLIYENNRVHQQTTNKDDIYDAGSQ